MTLQIALWLSFGSHLIGALIGGYLLLQRNTKVKEWMLLAFIGVALDTALYSLALALGQGITTKSDGNQSHWVRWGFSIICEPLLAFMASIYLKQKPITTVILMSLIGGFLISALFASLSTGYRIWIWTASAGLFWAMACYVFVKYPQNAQETMQKVMKYGFNVFYVIYGTFFLLGHNTTQIISITIETWGYVLLDIATKLVFWIYLFNYT